MAEFRRMPTAITKAGQVKGGGGRHEKDDRFRIDDRSRYVLGWSNESKIAALTVELGAGRTADPGRGLGRGAGRRRLGARESTPSPMRSPGWTVFARVPPRSTGSPSLSGRSPRWSGRGRRCSAAVEPARPNSGAAAGSRGDAAARERGRGGGRPRCGVPAASLRQDRRHTASTTRSPRSSTRIGMPMYRRGRRTHRRRWRPRCCPNRPSGSSNWSTPRPRARRAYCRGEIDCHGLQADRAALRFQTRSSGG